MNTSKSRATLLGIAGAYLLYIAYKLTQSLTDDAPASLPNWVLILAVACFALIGVTVIIHAWKVWKKGKEGEEADPDQDSSIK